MMALEMLVLVPLVLVLLLLVVGLGRYVHGRQLVEDASAAAARAASLTGNPAQATSEARRQAGDTLTQAGITCQQMNVTLDTSAFGPGGQVSVTVRCSADLSDLVMAGLPRTVHLVAVSTAALEAHRVFTP
jgi:Flp pilus assembly protein TadG